MSRRMKWDTEENRDIKLVCMEVLLPNLLVNLGGLRTTSNIWC